MDNEEKVGNFKKWPFRRFTTDEVLRKIGEMTRIFDYKYGTTLR